MYCSNCGKKVADEQKFCDNCGYNIKNVEPMKVQIVNPPKPDINIENITEINTSGSAFWLMLLFGFIIGSIFDVSGIVNFTGIGIIFRCAIYFGYGCIGLNILSAFASLLKGKFKNFFIKIIVAILMMVYTWFIFGIVR